MGDSLAISHLLLIHADLSLCYNGKKYDKEMVTHESKARSRN